MLPHRKNFRLGYRIDFVGPLDRCLYLYNYRKKGRFIELSFRDVIYSFKKLLLFARSVPKKTKIRMCDFFFPPRPSSLFSTDRGFVDIDNTPGSSFLAALRLRFVIYYYFFFRFFPDRVI